MFTNAVTVFFLFLFFFITIKLTFFKQLVFFLSLEEGGATALGPALIIAVNMAAQHPGSKVILCTDGKANIGLGKLEDGSEEEAALEFYTKTATGALEKG